MSFGKLEGYQQCKLFEKKSSKAGKLIVQSMSPNEFGEVPHTIAYKFQWAQCVKGN